jgi:hypothetical protein
MASSLQETKAMLMITNRHLQSAEGCLQDAAPTHTNEADGWQPESVKQKTI